MTSAEPFEADRIGPKLTLDAVALPPHVGERLASLYGRDDRIETAREWVDVMHAASERTQGRLPTADDLCRMDGGAHTVDVDGDTQSFVCVLDPLVVPFLEGTPGTVHSVTPEDGERVTIDVTADGVSADPATAVVSLGVARDVDPDAEFSLKRLYSQACEYIHVFASVDEYERWTDGVDGATTSVPVETGVALSREFASELFTDGDCC